MAVDGPEGGAQRPGFRCRPGRRRVRSRAWRWPGRPAARSSAGRRRWSCRRLAPISASCSMPTSSTTTWAMHSACSSVRLGALSWMPSAMSGTRASPSVVVPSPDPAVVVVVSSTSSSVVVVVSAGAEVVVDVGRRGGGRAGRLVRRCRRHPRSVRAKAPPPSSSSTTTAMPISRAGLGPSSPAGRAASPAAPAVRRGVGVGAVALVGGGGAGRRGPAGAGGAAVGRAPVGLRGRVHRPAWHRSTGSRRRPQRPSRRPGRRRSRRRRTRRRSTGSHPSSGTRAAWSGLPATRVRSWDLVLRVSEAATGSAVFRRVARLRGGRGRGYRGDPPDCPGLTPTPPDR